MYGASEMAKTERGFTCYDFVDIYGSECSFQESSLAEEAAIWLGCNEGLHHNGKCLARMHLNVELAIKIRDLLDAFIRENVGE